MNDTVIRDQLIALLKGGNAHKTFRDTVRDFPMDRINDHVPGIPYSPWELIEHIRRAQYDILDFIRNIDYQERKWPDDYWPEKSKVADETDWKTTIEQFQDDLDALKDIVNDPHTDLTSELPHAPGYTYFREILLAADHNAYHTGQLLSMQRALEA